MAFFYMVNYVDDDLLNMRAFGLIAFFSDGHYLVTSDVKRFG
jgi:hypothetical protein